MKQEKFPYYDMPPITRTYIRNNGGKLGGKSSLEEGELCFRKCHLCLYLEYWTPFIISMKSRTSLQEKKNVMYVGSVTKFSHWLDNGKIIFI